MRSKQSSLPGSGLIWLAGNSSLDNKHWLSNDTEPAVCGYKNVLDPPRSQPDVAHGLNKEALRRGLSLVAINCAVEESRIGSRSALRHACAREACKKPCLHHQTA